MSPKLTIPEVCMEAPTPNGEAAELKCIPNPLHVIIKLHWLKRTTHSQK